MKFDESCTANAAARNQPPTSLPPWPTSRKSNWSIAGLIKDGCVANFPENPLGVGNENAHTEPATKWVSKVKMKEKSKGKLKEYL